MWAVKRQEGGRRSHNHYWSAIDDAVVLLALSCRLPAALLPADHLVPRSSTTASSTTPPSSLVAARGAPFPEPNLNFLRHIVAAERRRPRTCAERRRAGSASLSPGAGDPVRTDVSRGEVEAVTRGDVPKASRPAGGRAIRILVEGVAVHAARRIFIWRQIHPRSAGRANSPKFSTPAPM